MTPASVPGPRRSAPAHRRAERHVLVVSYFFPPMGGAGVQRTVKFVKHLSELGWRATVITTRSRSYHAHDPSLLDELPPGTRVIRATDPPPLRWASMVFDHFDLDGLRACTSWPDPAQLWLPFALGAALRAIRQDRPDAIYSSSAPYSAHLVALLVAARTEIPWVADFRDEWANNPTAENQPAWSRRLSRRSERAIAARAAHVVTVADYFQIDGAEPGSGRRTTIPNGVDESDLALGPGVLDPPPGVFRLSHVGSLYGRQDAAPVAKALARLADRGDVEAERLELCVVGNVLLAQPPHAGSVPVVTTGYLDHAAAVAAMQTATVLLLYVHAGSLAPSGKLYEYLASERPILCVVERDNLAWRLVEEWGAGLCAEPGDPDAIDAAIAQLYSCWRDGRLKAPSGVRERVLARFSRRRLAGELDVVLREAVDGANRR